MWREDFRQMWRSDPFRAAFWVSVAIALVVVSGMAAVWAVLIVMGIAR